MSRSIHQQFLKLSKNISGPLHHSIKQIGVVKITSRQHIPLPELLCRSVAGQQLSTKAASTIWQRLLDVSNGKSLLEFIHSSKTEDLRTCGLSAAKCKTLSAIAHSFHTGHITAENLEKLDQKQRAKTLTSIWGVGPWTADMVNLFYFCDPDIWPDKDVAVIKTFQKLIGDDKDISTTAEKFSPYRSYLAMYMWQHKDNKPMTI